MEKVLKIKNDSFLTETLKTFSQHISGNKSQSSIRKFNIHTAIFSND